MKIIMSDQLQDMTDRLDEFKGLLYRASQIDGRSGNLHFYTRTVPDSEKVERKGIGHPDTLADALATEISREYCRYTVANFGAILNHNFDKVGFMGGRSRVEMGGGHMVSPIRVLLNGRGSTSFGGHEIPIRDIMTETTRRLMKERFPNLDVDRDLRFIYEVENESTSGEVMNVQDGSIRPFWYKPRNFGDIEYLNDYVANDMSTGTAHWPLSTTGQVVLSLERRLSSPDFKSDKPWLGNDIKLTAARHGRTLDLSIVVPQISPYVESVEQYTRNLDLIREEIMRHVSDQQPELDLNLCLNSRDRLTPPLELYLTYIGSCVEMGDEGFVGRGNRSQGVIDMTRPYSMEAPAGKNPAYSIGFVYTEEAQRIARRLYENIGVPVEVSLTSQNARKLPDPWDVTVTSMGRGIDRETAQGIIHDELDRIPEITIDFLEGRIHPY